MYRHVSGAILSVAVLVIASLCAGFSEAYEFSTHAALTREAYIRSLLNPGVSDLLVRLGIDALVPNLGVRYLDITADAMIVREASPQLSAKFAERKIADANNPSEFKPTLPSLPAWLMLG